ncbi:MAG: O-antigen ligase family protein [Eubacteriales bacterium]|nr:O-antigen ligase family protein [Eubacteriales bacterium]
MKIKIHKYCPPVIILFIVLYPKVLDYIPACNSLIHIIYILQIVFAFFVLGSRIVRIFIEKRMLDNRERCFVTILIFINLGFFLSDFYVGVFSQTFTINIRRTALILALYYYIEQANADKRYNIIKSSYYYLTALMFFNLVLKVMFPKGMAGMFMYTTEGYLAWTDTIGFLDADNRVSLFAFLYFFIAHIYIELYCDGIHAYKKNNYIITYILVIVNILLSKSGSGVLAMLVLLLLVFFIKSKKSIGNIVSWKGLTIISIVIAFFVTGKMTNVVSWLGSLMGKGVSLSGRTAIWAMAVEKIINSPIIGYGTLEEGAFFNIGYYTWYAHDQYLDFWLQGGILTLISFIILIGYTHSRIKRVAIKNYYIVYVASLVAFLALGVVEHFVIRNYYQFWCFICFAFVMSKEKVK